MHFFADLIATFFFVGRLPKAPGTFGSLAALPFAWFLWQLPAPWAWLIFVATYLLGVWAASSVVRRSGQQDHQSIVLDEVCGIFLVSSIAPHDYGWYALAFLLFRLFDIWKPGPVGWVDRRVKGGHGAMLDDLVAALLATLSFYAILYAAGKFGMNVKGFVF